LLDRQGANLLLEGLKLEQEILLVKAQIDLAKQDVLNKGAERTNLLTQAESNRASAVYQTNQGAAILSEKLIQILKVMVDSWNTHIASTPGVEPAFDSSAISSMAQSAQGAVQNNATPTLFAGGSSSISSELFKP